MRLIAIALTLGCVTSLGAQVDQHALAQQLLHGGREERSQAVAKAQSLLPQDTGPELRAALVALLEKMNRITADAAARKEPVSRLEDPELIAAVAHVVSGLQDPQAIPALAGALGSGSTLVRDALAEFGEPASADVLRIVTSSGNHYAVEGGLIALRFMVEGHGAQPLSSGTLQQIRQAAKQRLNGQQYFTTVWYAIDLAALLNDVELKRILESLATDRRAVAARGINGDDLIKMTQGRAAQRLAGAPASPTFRNAAERRSRMR
jgi:hypothetical protein